MEHHQDIGYAAQSDRLRLISFAQSTGCPPQKV